MDIASLQKKKVLVVGFGKTGQSLYKFLTHHKIPVSVSEHNSSNPALKELNNNKIPIELEKHTPDFFLQNDLIIVSPGVATDSEAFIQACEHKIPIISEIEFSFSFINKPIIGVTGTNGKTTTVHILLHLLKSLQINAVLAGNVGPPLIDFVHNQKNTDVFIVELSSFQLETINLFRHNIGIYLNIEKDHIDRYSSLLNYHKAKTRLFQNQIHEDFAILNKNFPLLSEIKSKGKLIFFNGDNANLLDDTNIKIKIDKYDEVIRVNNDSLKLRHNLDNCQSAILAVTIFDKYISNNPILPTLSTKYTNYKNTIEERLHDFQCLEHRIEFVGKFNNINFINDSKATNAAATASCIQNFPLKNIILLLGGTDKQTGYHELSSLCQKIKGIITYGEARPIILKHFENITKCHACTDLKQAVQTSFELAQKNDYVVLSPACSSFDEFKNYQERGRVFKKIIHEHYNKTLRGGTNEAQINK